MREVNYGNLQHTNEIFNDALQSLDNISYECDNKFSPMMKIKKQESTRNPLNSRKKLKTRISCPQILSTNNGLYPSLEGSL